MIYTITIPYKICDNRSVTERDEFVTINIIADNIDDAHNKITDAFDSLLNHSKIRKEKQSKEEEGPYDRFYR